MQAFDARTRRARRWLLAVARNRAIDYLRSVRTAKCGSAVELEETEHPSLFVDLEKEVLNSDQARRLRKAMEKLNANQRNAIELAYFEGLSQTEMAERMGQPLGTVKTWVRTALEEFARGTGSGGVGMTCDELREEYEMYALGMAGEPERIGAGRAPDRGCATCTRRRAVGARGTRRCSAMTAEPMAPPPQSAAQDYGRGRASSSAAGFGSRRCGSR